MFATSRYENSRSAGFATLQIVRGEPGAERLFVPLRRTELGGEIAGPFASLTLTHTYRFDSNMLPRPIEALYRFPLPGDAAVQGVTVRFGEVEIATELQPRNIAEQTYEEAKEEAQQAALLTRESPDVFTLAVAGIQPDTDVTITTRFALYCQAEDDGWSLRLPLTTAPRFSREDERDTRAAQGQPLAVLRDPGHRFALDVTIRDVQNVRSFTHLLRQELVGDGVRLTLQGGDAIPDRDLVLAWAASAAPLTGYVATRPEATYFAAMIQPSSDSIERIPREIVLLVDHSGSMEGAKWQAADWAVERFLTDLANPTAGRPNRFALGLFHDSTTWFAKAPQEATPERVASAVKFLRDHKDSGGTQLGVALEQALRLPTERDAWAREVVIITDAEVTDAGRILKLVENEASKPNRRRISVLCIDAAPNSLLANEMAARGGGIARFLTSDPAEDDVLTALDGILGNWSGVVLPKLRLRVDGKAEGAQAPGLHRDGMTYFDPGDLSPGRAVWLFGRTDHAAPLTLAMVNESGQVIGSAEASSQIESLPAFFGARRVMALEFLASSDSTPADVSSRLEALGYGQAVAGMNKAIYAENAQADAMKAVKPLLIEEALRFGIASSETAFVATRKEAGQKVAGRVIVGNALPSGWSNQFLSYNAVPATAYAPMPSAAPGVFRGFAPGMHMMASTASASDEALAGRRLVFDGPIPADGLIYDSAWPSAPDLPGGVTFSLLDVSLDDGVAGAGSEIWLYVGDLTRPRARVPLASLLRLGKARPLNIQRKGSEPVRLELIDKKGTLVGKGLKVTLGWR